MQADDTTGSAVDPAFAGRLRRWRRERGWTQAQLARRAGLAPTTISRIERGDDRPLGRTAEALAKALGVDADRLLGLTGQAALFPLPDQRRVDLIRRLLALDDERLEAAHARLVKALDDAALSQAGRPRRARSGKSSS